MDFLHRNIVTVWWRMTSRFWAFWPFSTEPMKTLLRVSRLSTKKNVQVLTNLDITFSIVYQLMKNKKLSFPMM